MEILKDYDFEVKYHLGTTNVVADALSRAFLHVCSFIIRDWDLLESFRDLKLSLTLESGRIYLN